MNNKPLVSIIIPVYNTANFLKKCLDSVLNQTFTNFEVICFNDASTDKSLEILRKYESKDPRVIVLNSDVNIRQGGGRNRCLQVAKGQYISFIDSDDWVDNNFLEKLYRAIKVDDADISMCDYYESYNDRNNYIELIGDITSLNQKDIKIKIIKDGFRLPASLFKRKIFFENDLFFPENIVYEDNALGTSLYLAADKIVKLNEALYFYRIDNESTTRTFNNFSFFDRIEASVIFLDNVKKINKYRDYEDYLDEKFVMIYYINTIFGALNNFHPVPKEKIIHVRDNVFNYITKEKFEKHIKSLPLKYRFILKLTAKFPIFSNPIGKFLRGYQQFRKSS